MWILILVVVPLCFVYLSSKNAMIMAQAWWAADASMMIIWNWSMMTSWRIWSWQLHSVMSSTTWPVVGLWDLTCVYTVEWFMISGITTSTLKFTLRHRCMYMQHANQHGSYSPIKWMLLSQTFMQFEDHVPTYCRCYLITLVLSQTMFVTSGTRQHQLPLPAKGWSLWYNKAWFRLQSLH